ncbi:MAG: hypothetical protein M1371_04620 [Actinobacteria bacterium]|nr:hypothetical protein [Actinomycetota bacterium]
MKYEFKPSFDKTLRKLDSVRKERVLEAVSHLIDFFETGEKTKGLGLKHLRENFWEVRIDIRDRIVFAIEGDTIGFVVVGSHDEIKKFLKN